MVKFTLKGISNLTESPAYFQQVNGIYRKDGALARVDAHLFISILAYHLLHTIRHQLKLQNIDSSWQTIRQIFSTQVRITTTMRLENNKLLSVRRTSKATPEQVVIYKSLGMNSQPGHTEKTIC